MATPAPTGTDVTELKFMLQGKVPIYKGDGNARDGCNLLAAASVHGLIFVGTTGPQLKVLQLKDITPDKVIDEIIPLRTVPLPSEPFQMAVSSDHGFLAVDVVVSGVPIIQVYSVPSFLTPSIVKLNEIRTSAEGGVRSTQILWNPVIHNMFSVRTENGALSVYTLKEPSGIEFHSLDKSEGAICACWSPKGKQLVVGFANGKLMQYKPDLKPARTIVCPPGVMEGSFDVIAVQWLSTYQFAAVYLPHGEDSVPSLFIVNAPKVGNPTFINYDDICYSQSGPRKGQVFLVHILQWNLLLMASANSMEVGILGTTETGEAPTWLQWTTTDEARAELPLSLDKQETLPIGLALETGCTHQVTIAEQIYPVMPMIHLLSTYGMLVSFNVLNLMPNAPNICCPPRPTADTSGKFEKVDVSRQSAPAPVDITFTVPAGATSTPAVTKAKSFFSPNESKSPANLFGLPTSGAAAPASVAPAIAPTFGKPITFASVPQLAASAEQPKTTPFGSGAVPSFVGPSKPFAPPQQSQPSLLKTTIAQPPQQQQKPPSEASKPLVTIPPTYTPPPPADVSRSSSSDNLSKQPPKQVQKKQESTDDTNSVIRTMITEEIRKFERELTDLQKRCKNLNTTIGSKEQSTTIIKSLKELQDLSVQAAESTESLTSDVQALRLGLNEAFAMVAEANSKDAIYKHPSPNQFQETHAMSQSSRRQLASLQNMFAINENQLQIVNKQIDAQWSGIQEASRINSKRRMHVPSLEVLYQTLSKQQEILNRQREKLSYIKAKLGMRESIRGLEKGRKKDLVVDNVDSLTDSIISLTIADQVREDARRLSEAKMSSLRDMLKNRKVVTVKPSRPDRIGLNSEVVLQRRNEVRRLNLEKEKVKSEVVAKPSVSILPNAAPIRRAEEKHRAQPKYPSQSVSMAAGAAATVKPVAAEPAKPFELPKAAGLPNFGSKPAAAAVATVAQQASAAAPSFGFGSTPMQAPSPAATTKPAAAVIFGAGGTSSAATSVFNFKQPTKPFGQTSAPQDVPITKETTLFGSTTIKPVQVTSTISSKDKENQEPTPKTTVFGFGSTTIQAISKADSSTNGNSEPSKPVLTFSAAANSKPAFSFGSAIGGSTAFGAPQPGPVLKEKEPEVKKDEPLPPSFGTTGSSDEDAKTAFPALTNLLQKVDTTAAEAPKTQSPFGSSAKATTASNIFGTSTAIIAPGTGIFGTIKPAATTTTSSSSSGLLSAFNVGGADSAATSTADSAVAVTTEASSSTAAVTTSTTSTLFGSVKPATTTTTSSGFAFGGSGGFNFGTATKATDLSVKSDTSTVEATPIFGTVTSTTATPVSSTVTTASTTPAVTSSTVVTTTTTATTPSDFSFGSVVTPSPTPASSAPAVTSASSPTSTYDATSNLFGSFNICSPSAAAASPAASGNIFGCSSFSTPKSETMFVPSSAFGAVTTDASKPTSIFGTTAAAAAIPMTAGTGLFGTVTASSTSSPFSATTGSTSTGNLFGSIASPAASTGSIFGGTSAATQQPTSPFGAAGTATAPATTASSIFGGTSSTSGGLFGSVQTSPSAAGGSIFGGTSAFGSSAAANTSTGNIFGGATPGAAATGFGSSAFGQPSSPPQSGQSIFGGAVGSTPGFGSSSFGSPAPSGGAFSSPTAGSVAQSGFGSLNSSAFNKPAFGGTPAFGATPAFGGAPAFGGSPVFGSSPSFGNTAFGFGQAPLSPSSQSNNLFEQLGSSSSGVSFGNLAQQQADKPPQFGGSSFSSWR
ncbi:nuclear pore complex protein Nup214 [Ochlerotatus camptorhynchus]|uniref:nuclear pore complex protein Nup214 n=1 Tax=Ochlerotatus camptorhynchus TaxID=644619 RepID=UPI0031DF938E